MRLTREETQKHTRARLLAAARDQIARHGIAATSIRGIADAAGFTQGAFYSNFESKEAMLLALMEEHALGQTVTFRDIVAAEHGTLEETLTAIFEWLSELKRDSIWSMLSIELQMHANRNPEFASSYDASKRAHHAGFAAGLQILFKRLKLTPPLPVLQLAISANALWAGLGIEGTVKEAAPAEELMMLYFRAILATAKKETKRRATPAVDRPKGAGAPARRRERGPRERSPSASKR